MEDQEVWSEPGERGPTNVTGGLTRGVTEGGVILREGVSRRLTRVQ